MIHKGECVATFQHRRLKEAPATGGVAILAVAEEPDPELLQSSMKLLRALDWEGVAMVEFRVDRETGSSVLMEVNGRFWGSLQLAIDAGVDFPSLLLASAFGRRFSPVTRYTKGIRGRWFWGDVDHLYLRLAKSPEALHLKGDERTRWEVIRDFLRHRP